MKTTIKLLEDICRNLEEKNFDKTNSIEAIKKYIKNADSGESLLIGEDIQHGLYHKAASRILYEMASIDEHKLKDIISSIFFKELHDNLTHFIKFYNSIETSFYNHPKPY